MWRIANALFVAGCFHFCDISVLEFFPARPSAQQLADQPSSSQTSPAHAQQPSACPAAQCMPISPSLPSACLARACPGQILVGVDDKDSFSMATFTDYGQPVRMSPSLHGRKSNPNPNFLGTGEALVVCHLDPKFQIYLIYAFIGCP